MDQETNQTIPDTSAESQEAELRQETPEAGSFEVAETPEETADRLVEEAEAEVEGIHERGKDIASGIAGNRGTFDGLVATELDEIEGEARKAQEAFKADVRLALMGDVLVAGDEEGSGTVEEVDWGQLAADNLSHFSEPEQRQIIQKAMEQNPLHVALMLDKLPPGFVDVEELTSHLDLADQFVLFDKQSVPLDTRIQIAKNYVAEFGVDMFVGKKCADYLLQVLPIEKRKMPEGATPVDFRSRLQTGDIFLLPQKSENRLVSMFEHLRQFPDMAGNERIAYKTALYQCAELSAALESVPDNVKGFHEIAQTYLRQQTEKNRSLSSTIRPKEMSFITDYLSSSGMKRIDENLRWAKEHLSQQIFGAIEVAARLSQSLIEQLMDESLPAEGSERDRLIAVADSLRPMFAIDAEIDTRERLAEMAPAVLSQMTDALAANFGMEAEELKKRAGGFSARFSSSYGMVRFDGKEAPGEYISRQKEIVLERESNATASDAGRIYIHEAVHALSHGGDSKQDALFSHQDPEVRRVFTEAVTEAVALELVEKHNVGNAFEVQARGSTYEREREFLGNVMEQYGISLPEFAQALFSEGKLLDSLFESKGINEEARKRIYEQAAAVIPK